MTRVKRDLHTHSNASDGSLAPAELVALAAENGVGLLALTDHDTLAGNREAREAALDLGVDFVPGVEVSCAWGGLGIHVVGLGVDPDDEELTAAFRATAALRLERAREMGRRFEALGMPGAFEGALAIAGAAAVLSRNHFALWLLEKGYVERHGEAFARYLLPGKPGFVASAWPAMAKTVALLRRRKAVPVLAHPGRYKVCADWEREALMDDFIKAGGLAIEVSSGSQPVEMNEYFADVVRARGLWASVGSDWHSRRSARPLPGDAEPLPADLPFVTELLH